MKKTNSINFTEKIPEVSKQIEEIKITCFYMLSTDLYKIENNKLTEIIIKKFENHPATIMTLIATEDNQLFSKKHEPWKIPKELHHLKSEVDEKTNYYLDLYFKKLEKEKQSSLFIYRINHRAIFDLFTHLQKNSYFKHDEYIEKIKQEEFNLLKERNQFNELQKDRIMEIMLFIVSLVSVLQVVDIFTNNIKILSISALITISLSVGILIYRNRK